jgi:DNA repair protein RecO (recombination protein O)
MPPITSDALILRTYALGETSKIVVLLTRERGKLRAVAKGARGGRPRYQSALEPLSQVRVSLYGRQGAELFRLGDCELLHSAFRTASSGLEASMALSFVAELLDAFSPEGEVDDAVYRLALAVIAAAENRSPAALLLRYVEAWLLRLHGLYPPLDRCAACALGLAVGERSYDRIARGFVCGSCRPPSGPVLSPEVVGFLTEVFRKPPAALFTLPRDSAPLEAFHRDLIEHHLERDLRSHRVMKDVAREVRG